MTAPNIFAGMTLGQAVDVLMNLKERTTRLLDAAASGRADYGGTRRAVEELAAAEYDFAAAFDTDVVGKNGGG